MLTTAAIFGLLSLSQAAGFDCVAEGGSFKYPRLANTKRVYGELVVRVSIGRAEAPAALEG
jgi:hypothetical protein